MTALLLALLALAASAAAAPPTRPSPAPALPRPRPFPNIPTFYAVRTGARLYKFTVATHAETYACLRKLRNDTSDFDPRRVRDVHLVLARLLAMRQFMRDTSFPLRPDPVAPNPPWGGYRANETLYDLEMFTAYVGDPMPTGFVQNVTTMPPGRVPPYVAVCGDVPPPPAPPPRPPSPPVPPSPAPLPTEDVYVLVNANGTVTRFTVSNHSQVVACLAELSAQTNDFGETWRAGDFVMLYSRLLAMNRYMNSVVFPPGVRDPDAGGALPENTRVGLGSLVYVLRPPFAYGVHRQGIGFPTNVPPCHRFPAPPTTPPPAPFPPAPTPAPTPAP